MLCKIMNFVGKIQYLGRSMAPLKEMCWGKYLVMLWASMKANELDRQMDVMWVNLWGMNSETHQHDFYEVMETRNH